MTRAYERPRIDTVPASRIVELMGPVSCGSGGTQSFPVSGGIGSPGSSTGGLKHFE